MFAGGGGSSVRVCVRVLAATEGFLTVEMPPHRLALRPHARTDALSLRSVFSFLPSGAIMALGTNSLFNLCEDTPIDGEAAPAASSALLPTAGVCTSFRDVTKSAHPRLLRTSSPATAKFVVANHEAVRAPKPKAANGKKG